MPSPCSQLSWGGGQLSLPRAQAELVGVGRGDLVLYDCLPCEREAVDASLSFDIVHSHRGRSRELAQHGFLPSLARGELPGRCHCTLITVRTTSVPPALSSLKSHMAGQIYSSRAMPSPCLQLSWGGGQLSLPPTQAEPVGVGGDLVLCDCLPCETEAV